MTIIMHSQVDHVCNQMHRDCNISQYKIGSNAI